MSDGTDYGRMDEKDVQAADSIAMAVLGRHFSAEVGRRLIALIEAAIEPEGEDGG